MGGEGEGEGEGVGVREKGGAGGGWEMERERERGRVGERAGEGEGDTQLHEKFSQPQRQKVRLAQESVLVPASSPVMTHHLYTSSFIKHDKQSLLAISFARVASSYPPLFSPSPFLLLISCVREQVQWSSCQITTESAEACTGSGCRNKSFERQVNSAIKAYRYSSSVI